ncbi:flagellar hook-associated protein FlgK [Desulfospira joergensenii]|uniref:flagellar hook-associated protein FlgK n=1 Tax=Desulfospira joergensenii TaxID=53329 RepID=UPI0003B599C5|nr:flagellar hook-associated protein FlgK [Desulfospira joergensenii]
MSSLNAILNMAQSALRTYQAAISVTGQNAANADNTTYSIQTLEYGTTKYISSGGQIYGTGVTVASVTREINQLLENRLTTEVSTQAALEQELVYMTQIEDLFSEDSADSLNTLLDNYWSAWESLSNTPSVATEQEKVYTSGLALAQRLNEISQSLGDLVQDLDREISSAMGDINSITAELAALNKAIMTAESSGANANDLSDRRNALVDELGELIDIDLTVKEDGSYLISTGGGLPLVEDYISHPLQVSDDRVYWCGVSGTTHDITDDISGGSLAGSLTIRDAALPETLANLNELVSNLIWTLNYQHSQGTGQSYFSGPLEGTYATGESGVLNSLAYGDKIDYLKDFSMVIQNSGSSISTYQTVLVDMGISQAEIFDILGTGRANSTYELTVIDGGVLGEQSLAQSLAGGGITSSASGSVADALNAALAEQVLIITGGEENQRVRISDSGSGARRSAAQIAAELNDIDGISANASGTEAEFSLNGVTNAQDGDILSFTLHVDGQEEIVEFTVDSSAGTLGEQFEDALESAAQKINQTNGDTDLLVNGTSIESASGATIGIQDFGVVDNAGVALDNFQNFNAGDTLTLTVATDATPSELVTVTVDLTDVDTTDADEMAQVFYGAISNQISDEPFTVELNEATGQVIVRTTDGTGLILSAASGDTGNDASMDVTTLGTGTAIGDGQLDFDGTDQESATPDNTADDCLGFSLPGCSSSGSGSATILVGEAGGIYDTAAVLTGSVTILLDPGMEITSSDTSLAGLFGTKGRAGGGNGMITLGGTGGYANFSDGDLVSFEVDGYTVSYNVTDPGTGLTDEEQAEQLYSALSASLPSDGYEVVKNGTSVTIVRTAESDTPLAITGFTDTGLDASLAVSTGTGTGADAPENNILVSGDALKNFTSAVTWGDPAIVYWEIYDSDGKPTGESGYVEIDEPGTVEIKENGSTTLFFEVSQGSLVAGNTMRINTDEAGEADLLDLSVAGKANSIDDTYEFRVKSGGSLPDNDEPLVIEWSSGSSSGTLTIEGSSASHIPVFVEVDGMTIQLNGGTLVEGEVFYVTTDESGRALSLDGGGDGTAETLSDWHWTLDSFADEFNRSAGGVTARVTRDHTMVFDTDEDYCAMENISYSGADGISQENTRISVLNYTALTLAAQDLSFTRSDGVWTIENDPSGGTLQIIPEGGDDDGFMVDLDGDGLGDIKIRFDRTVTGDGTIQMDLAETDPSDFSFAFAGDKDGDSGLASALGLNTFFTGTDAQTIGVNKILEDGDYLASGMVDKDTGEISSADNINSLAMANTRDQTLSMKQWEYTRGKAAAATSSKTCLDDYQATLASVIGYGVQSVQTSLDYSKLLVYQLTQQRDSVSAVSLDEEMIKLTAQQAAYSAAAKLLTAVDEMFETLLAVR